MSKMDDAKAKLAAKRAQVTDAEREASSRDVPPGVDQVPRFANVWAKLGWVQNRIRVNKNRGKGHDNRPGVTYEFRNAEDILEAAKPLCAEVGAIVTLDVNPAVVGESVPVDVRVVQTRKDDYGNVSETFVPVEGPRFAAIAVAIFTDVETGEELRRSSFAFIDAWRKGQTEPEKLCGSADSYASKYALGHLFALDNNRDADMESNAAQPAAPAPIPADCDF